MRELATLTGLLKKAASDFPDRIAVSVRGGEFEFDLTHARLQELVDHAAALLAASRVGPGDVVALAFPNTVELVILFLAVIRCRATATLLDPAYTAVKFNFYLSVSESKLLLTPQEGNRPAQSAAFELNIPHLTAKLHSADSKITLSSTDIEPDLDSMSKVINDPSDVALYLHTWGATSRPQGTLLTQLDLASEVQLYKSDTELTERHYNVIELPLFDRCCLVTALLSYLAAGAAVALPVAKPTEENKFKTERGGEEENRSFFGLSAGPENRVDMLPDNALPCPADNVHRPKLERVCGRRYPHGIDVSAENLCGPKDFSYEELMMGTDSFASSRVLGEGGSGIVYEGLIGDPPTLVAVKMIKSGSARGMKEFRSEVTTLSQLRHKNLVRLIGYCCEANKFVLVYEFMREGSLGDHLFEGKTLLTWEMRYNIARGLASGVHYLHEECDPYVLHRDIKSSNTMLDENFIAKLIDFGLARLVDPARWPKTTERLGTWGYAAPEYCETGKPSKESDVYSFGVVLLEIGSGEKATDCKQDPGGLVEWVWKQYGRGKLLDAVDSKLGKEFDKKQAEALMIVGLWCAHPIAGSRPSIEGAMDVLKLKAKLPKFLMPRSQHIIDPKVSFGCFGF